MLAAWLLTQTNTYLSVFISSSPPLHQEVVALGEAWGRHSRTASPPRWITVAFFTGRRVKWGGEAEEQICVEAVCLCVWGSNGCASAENVKCITSNYGNCISPPNELIVWKKYGNERQRHVSVKSHFSHILFVHVGGTLILLNVDRMYSVAHSPPPFTVCEAAKSSAYLQPWAQHWHRRTHAHYVLHTDTFQNPTGWSWIWSVFQLQCGLDPIDQDSQDLVAYFSNWVFCI